MRCNQCDSAYINGVFCHETGCPNSKKVYNQDEEIWEYPENDDFEDYDGEEYEPDFEQDERDFDATRNHDQQIDQQLMDYYEDQTYLDE